MTAVITPRTDTCCLANSGEIALTFATVSKTEFAPGADASSAAGGFVNSRFPDAFAIGFAVPDKGRTSSQLDPRKIPGLSAPSSETTSRYMPETLILVPRGKFGVVLLPSRTSTRTSLLPARNTNSPLDPRTPAKITLPSSVSHESLLVSTALPGALSAASCARLWLWTAGTRASGCSAPAASAGRQNLQISIAASAVNPRAVVSPIIQRMHCDIPKWREESSAIHVEGVVNSGAVDGLVHRTPRPDSLNPLRLPPASGPPASVRAQLQALCQP